MSYIISICNKILIILVLGSCSNLKCEDDEWIGKELRVPEINYEGLKIVVRFQADCPACIESIEPWDKFVRAVKAKNENVKIVFYVEVVDQLRFQEIESMLFFADKVIYDQKGQFYSKNLLKFPYPYIDYHAFLLDSQNKIIIYGNPTMKRELIRRYINLL